MSAADAFRSIGEAGANAARALGEMNAQIGGMGLDLDEGARNAILNTMRAHRVREEISTRRGASWACACGSTSRGRPVSDPEHQAQQVLDALRGLGWRSTYDGEIIDGELVQPAAIEASPLPHAASGS